MIPVSVFSTFSLNKLISDTIPLIFCLMNHTLSLIFYPFLSLSVRQKGWKKSFFQAVASSKLMLYFFPHSLQCQTKSIFLASLQSYFFIVIICFDLTTLTLLFSSFLNFYFPVVVFWLSSLTTFPLINIYSLPQQIN